MVDTKLRNLSSSEISFEERFRPRSEPISHIDSQHGHMLHDRVLHEHMNAPDDDNAIAGGHMKTGEAISKLESSENAEHSQKKKKERSLDKLLYMLESHIAWLDGEIAKLDLQIDELTERIETMESVLDAIQNGIPLSEEQEALAAKYLREDGTYDVKAMQRDIDKDKEALAKAMKDRSDLERERDAAADFAEKVRQNPNDPTVQQKLQEYSSSIEGQRVLDTAIFAADDLEAKTIMINSMVQAEADIQAIKERVLTGNSEGALENVGYGDDFDRFFDSHLRTTSAAKAILGDTDSLSSMGAFNTSASLEVSASAPSLETKPEVALGNRNTATLSGPKPV